MNTVSKFTSTLVVIVFLMLLGMPQITVAQQQPIKELQAQIAVLLSQIKELRMQIAVLEASPVCGFTFERNIHFGSTGSDVRNLQRALNSNPDTRLAVSGAGAPGNETEFFGTRTRLGAIQFQEKFAPDILTPLGLNSGTGFVGPSTRVKLNSLFETCPSRDGNGGVIPILAEFDTKVVYTTDITHDADPLVKDCKKRGGTFNTCGSVCAPEAEVCITACALTCEL